MVNKAQQIRGYKQANPTHKPSDIAKACGVTTAYVYQVLHNVKKKTVKPVAAQPTAGQEVLRQEITRLNEHIADLKYERTQMDNLMAEYREECRKLKLHHGGLEYIISYLESRLGIKEQDGTTV
jgi:TolA-binding protein